ncbi:MAG: glycosyltransferase family 4 protein [Cyclobacteriaceae bacterium]|nr:glycosyltransferase family 4 protein [Cyclobacteriaceae bacterium]
MKILHLSTEPSWRGGERQILFLHQELLAKGIDSSIACRENSPVHDFCIENKLPFIAWPFRSAYDLITAHKIKSFCRENSIHILHMHTAKGHTLGVMAGLMGLKITMVLSRRVDFSVKHNWLSRFKYNYPAIKKIICVSDKIREIMRPDLVNPSVLTVVHSGIDLRPFENKKKNTYLKEKYKLPGGTILIGNTSALADHKDYFTFIDTAKALTKTRKGVKFFIIGEGPLEKEIRAYIKDNQLENDIIMTGFITEIPYILKSLDVFLFTSKTEGLGTSVLDALAAGLPVVATRAGGVKEIISHQENGYLCETGDIQSLAESVSDLIENPGKAQKFINKGYETVKKFSKAATAQKTLEIYQQLLDTK